MNIIHAVFIGALSAITQPQIITMAVGILLIICLGIIICSCKYKNI
jgi:hypothetical protein